MPEASERIHLYDMIGERNARSDVFVGSIQYCGGNSGCLRPCWRECTIITTVTKVVVRASYISQSWFNNTLALKDCMQCGARAFPSFGPRIDYF
jgi:hypothetical protein